MGILGSSIAWKEFLNATDLGDSLVMSTELEFGADDEQDSGCN